MCNWLWKWVVYLVFILASGVVDIINIEFLPTFGPKDFTYKIFDH